jgi:hypothetical protein
MLDARVPVLALALLAAACGREAPERQEAAVLPPEPPRASVVAPAPTTYTCARGQSLQVSYPDPETALIAYGGRTFTLRRLPEPTGLRYVGDGREWVMSGADGSSSGSLRETQADSTLAGPLIAECSTVGGVTTTQP